MDLVFLADQEILVDQVVIDVLMEVVIYVIFAMDVLMLKPAITMRIL